VGKKHRRRLRRPPESLASASVAIHELRRDLDALRSTLSTEVVTRRVTVLDARGSPRVIIGADAKSGNVAVLARDGNDVVCVAELFSEDAQRGERAYSSLTLVDRGDVAAVLDVVDGDLPALWLGDR
jgi:hypothetical protein